MKTSITLLILFIHAVEALPGGRIRVLQPFRCTSHTIRVIEGSSPLKPSSSTVKDSTTEGVVAVTLASDVTTTDKNSLKSSMSTFVSSSHPSTLSTTSEKNQALMTSHLETTEKLQTTATLTPTPADYTSTAMKETTTTKLHKKETTNPVPWRCLRCTTSDDWSTPSSTITLTSNGKETTKVSNEPSSPSGSNSISFTTDPTSKQTLTTTETGPQKGYSSEPLTHSSGSQPLTTQHISSSTKGLTSSSSSSSTLISDETSETSTDDGMSSQASTRLLVSTTHSTDANGLCPANMIYTYCTCQKTCQNPDSCSVEHECVGLSCICPEGFYLQDNTCVHPRECGCFFETFVLKAGSTAVNSDCSRKCACTNDALVCDATYQCHLLATCEADSNGMMACRCGQGFYGDGLQCQAEKTGCLDVYNSGTTTDGTSFIKPVSWSGSAFEVYCDMTSTDGPWLVFQRRTSGSYGFNQAWSAYQDGFGFVSDEFWIGNEKLFYLTSEKQYELRIDFTDTNGLSYHVTYDHFAIGDSSQNYGLVTLGAHGGNAADALRSSVGRAFSTVDSDNFDWSNPTCDYERNGGWWYSPGETACFDSTLNGDFYGTINSGITWGKYTKVKSVEMKLRQKQ